MFRKRKNVKTAAIRQRNQQRRRDDDNDDSSADGGGKNQRTHRRNGESDSDDEEDARIRQEELLKARKRAKTGKFNDYDDDDDTKNKKKSNLMHQFETSKEGPKNLNDLVTSTNEYHPTKAAGSRTNKLLAGPIKATTHIRTTCRFDYQPDICKDYKDTGFCGFGDTCIYLHDRGDTLSGWQLEQQWQQEQEAKRKQQEAAMEEFMNGNDNKKTDETAIPDDGIPFACFLCRNAFNDPQVTTCGHYFCQSCIVKHVKEVSVACPICNKDTHTVFHEPTKLLSKKRKIVGRDASWEDYKKACQNNNDDDDKKE